VVHSVTDGQKHDSHHEVVLWIMSRIFVAGHRGLVGSALVRRLGQNVLTVDRRTLDLRDQAAVNKWFSEHSPDIVYLAAATVGGIVANANRPADFILDNLLIQTNVINASLTFGVKRFVFFGSSCIYPKMAPQPIKEEYLLSGPLEPTNDAYAVSKIAGYTLCEAFRRQHGFDYVALMPTNLYGRNDNYSPIGSHVIPGLIRKIHEAKLRGDKAYTCWGTGSARREFLYSDDLASAAVKLAESNAQGLVNVGYGSDITIRELVEEVASAVGFQGDIEWDPTKPDGTPRKMLDSTRLNSLIEWTPRVDLTTGLDLAYQDFLASNVRLGV
jgi:GDP-L-fucose synthase